MIDYAELRAALEAGVTGASDPTANWLCVGGHTVMLNSGRPVWARIATCEHAPNASYIAACHPDTIRALLAERDALREALENLLNVREGKGGTKYPADDGPRRTLTGGIMTTKTDTEQLRAEFEAWASQYTNYPQKYDQIPAWQAYQAGRAALQSQDREDAERFRFCLEHGFPQKWKRGFEAISGFSGLPGQDQRKSFPVLSKPSTTPAVLRKLNEHHHSDR